MEGVALEIYHPQISSRDCDYCRKWMHDDSENGTKMVSRSLGTANGVTRKRRLVRQNNTPCETSQGCPKGHYDAQKGLTLKNRLAWFHYQECRATGNFPEDDIVSRNAGIIYRIEAGKEQHDREMLRIMLSARV